MKTSMAAIGLSGVGLLLGGTLAFSEVSVQDKVKDAYAKAQAKQRQLAAGFEKAAFRKDPAYARLKKQHDELNKRVFALMHENQVVVGAEGQLDSDVPEELAEAMMDFREVTVAMEKTKGYRQFIHAVAEQALNARQERNSSQLLPAAVATTTKKYYINIYRDPSVPWYTPDYTLKDYVNTAMGTISSEVWWNTYASYDVAWQINGVYRNVDLSGCGAGSPPGGSGSTFNVVFRSGEAGYNGWGVTGSWAEIELSPPYACRWTWDWDNQPTTTHEIGHVFGANHYTYTQCGSYNDTECSSNGCGFEWCDSAAFPVCVEEYADAGFYGVYDDFCPNDEKCLINYVKYGSSCSAQ